MRRLLLSPALLFVCLAVGVAGVAGVAGCGGGGGGGAVAPTDTFAPGSDAGDAAAGEIVFCAWTCDRLECGTDGCGNVCGTCEAGHDCLEGACVASCASACEGRTCGDDGCGGTCGACGADEVCAGGRCDAPCEPRCDDLECGENGCGGSCGVCSAGEQCFGGDCMVDCTPDCAGKACGPDGCGTTCGACAADETCGNGQCAAACSPQCDGLACGPNGCGGVCGTCAAGTFCVAGSCEDACTSDCVGKVCGDDGCGGSCGTCGAGESCAAGTCTAACAPACTGRTCGDDGCGGSCGTCGAGESCSAGACVTICTPSCAGRVCGDNGCGGTCGTCAAGAACVGGGCVAGCQPACGGRVCGADGCGGSCGTCGPGEACSDGACSAICAPSCAARECGDNGCGGSCGSCADGLVCTDHRCSEETALVDWCRFQWPREATVEVGKPLTVYVRVHEAGITDRTSAVDVDPALRLEAGVAPDGAGEGADVWAESWVAAFPNEVWDDVEEPGNDEYMALLTAPAAAGSYDMAFRATADGGAHWVWCDLVTAAGDGSADGYQPSNAAALTAMCVPDCGDRACGPDGCGAACGTCDPGASCQDGVCVVAANPADWCRLQWPLDASAAPNEAFTAYVRVYEAGVTDQSDGVDAAPALLVDGGLGPDGAGPTDDDWLGWTRAAPNPAWSGTAGGEPDNDEYMVELVAPSAEASYDFAFRASADGGATWTYCDRNGSDDGYQEANAGTLAVVVACAPSCEGRACGDDGCGGTCGDCAEDATCEDGQCVVPCVPACDGPVCGDDGCGDVCGSCADGESCVEGACVPDCVQACDGRACGDDGCGGVCGECSVGLVCAEGQCVDLPSFGWCRYQWPTAETAAPGGTFTAYVHVYVAGVTDRTSGTDASSRLNVAHSVMNDGDDPAAGGGGTFGWTVAVANEGWSDGGEPNNDEYQSLVTAPLTPGTYDMAFSVTLDGSRTMFCDLSAGLGSDGSEDGYQTANAATLVVE